MISWRLVLKIVANDDNRDHKVIVTGNSATNQANHDSNRASTALKNASNCEY